MMKLHGIDQTAYTDNDGMSMEVRVDNAFRGTAYQDSDYCQFGLYNEGNRIGQMDMSMAYEPVDWSNENTALRYTDARIHYMEVDSEYRGAGNGSQLLNTAEQAANAYGAERIVGTPKDEQALG
ncbi:MAG: GNAT family N-acetyltransferase [Roseiflexaceae bacterium]|nr:GNAT family N-acetyltransferase [Roseiflexaceae bacterium]